MEAVLDSAQSESKALRYAGFWLRFVAALIDGLILWAIGALISLMFFGAIFISYRTHGWSVFSSNLIVGAIINWLYYAGMESSARQATFGKVALSVKVTDLNQERISFARATGRHFAKYISAITLLIGYMMAGFTEKKQALHDQIADTLVILK